MVLLVVRFLIITVGSSLIQLNFHIAAYCQNKSLKQKKIALTFDDGPTEFTPAILDLLERYKAKATFFCIGANIEKRPQLLKEIAEKGHEIGNHTFYHGTFFDFKNSKEVLEELKKTDTLLEQVLGTKPRFFRPPYGVTNPSIKKALQVSKHMVIGWNIRSLDTILKDETKIVNRIIKQIQPGSIILLHDTSEKTVRVVAQLLLFLQQEEYEIISLDELIQA